MKRPQQEKYDSLSHNVGEKNKNRNLRHAWNAKMKRSIKCE